MLQAVYTTCCVPRLSKGLQHPVLPALRPQHAPRLRYIIGMKLLMTALLICATSIASFAQTKNPAPPRDNPLSLVDTAVTITLRTQQQNFDGFVAVYISPENWDAALKDGDLGPFLKLKEKKPGRSAVVVVPPNANTEASTVCVYFDGDKALGVTAAHSKDGAKPSAGDIANAYKAVNNAMTEKKGLEFELEPGQVSTDDGGQLPAYTINHASRNPAR